MGYNVSFLPVHYHPDTGTANLHSAGWGNQSCWTEQNGNCIDALNSGFLFLTDL